MPTPSRPNPFSPRLPPAILALADGTVFHGYSFGAAGMAVGEVVFNTAMTGYQEILTDPSYCRQLVTLTYPQIGNYGVNAEDMESDRVHAEALIIKALPVEVSNWRGRALRSGGDDATDRGGDAADGTLPGFLRRWNRPGILGIDTRKLTRLLREKGAQAGCLIASDPRLQGSADAVDAPRAQDVGRALQEARAFGGLAGLDLARVVTVAAAYPWSGGSWDLAGGYRSGVGPAGGAEPYHVVAFDFGVKRNILRLLADRGCRITVVPATTSARDVLALAPDGVFLSNGPGDPEPCEYAIAATRELIDAGLPTFGICLGHQIMGLASGARTMKMKFGHHGANHPVKDLDTGKVYITSQNHGFAVDPDSIGGNLRVTHRSLFDGSVQGLARTDRPAFCFQGHPEASPGPQDIGYLFDRFVASIASHRKA